jgi:metal-sulfur cluster biosynthetic enzyme
MSVPADIPSGLVGHSFGHGGTYPQKVTAAPPTADHVMGLMSGVIDPELGSDIVELGMAKGADVSDDGVVTLEIALTTSG